jgi:hypothetical protein
MIVYKYLHPDRLDVLSNGCIRFTQPAVLNDPFETLPAFTAFRDRQLKEIAPDFSRRMEVFETLGIKTDDLLNSLFDSVYDKVVAQLFSQHFGILSLSRCRDNILMWSHYADSHRGFVIGFDSENKFFAPSNGKANGGLRDVKYSKKRPMLPADGLDSLNTDGMNTWNENILFTKSEDWAYEQEMRILASPSSADHRMPGNNGWDVCLYSFDSHAIKEIIVGSRASVETQNKLSQIWLNQYQDAEMLTSTISPTDFSVEIK